jgi:Ricin-type beta-trefoil lectin domain-like
MNSKSQGKPPNDRLFNIRNRWLEGTTPMPRAFIPVCEANVNNLLTILTGPGRNSHQTSTINNNITKNVSQPVTIVNKLSDKALEIGNLLDEKGARIQQNARNGAANQRWFVKHAKFIMPRSLPRIAGRELLRYWPTFLRFPQAVYSIIADHSGLCLGILNDSTENSVGLQQSPVKRGNNLLWVFVSDLQGFNFIVNVYSGQVLDVADISLKNYAQVRQYPFTGADSQRWQLIH